MNTLERVNVPLPKEMYLHGTRTSVLRERGTRNSLPPGLTSVYQSLNSPFENWKFASLRVLEVTVRTVPNAFTPKPSLGQIPSTDKAKVCRKCEIGFSRPGDQI